MRRLHALRLLSSLVALAPVACSVAAGSAPDTVEDTPTARAVGSSGTMNRTHAERAQSVAPMASALVQPAVAQLSRNLLAPQRTAAPSQPIYDIAISSILSKDILHAEDVANGQLDADHLYFAVVGAVNGVEAYAGSYDDGASNFYANMKPSVTPWVGHSSFLIPGLPIESGDFLQLAVLMDSRVNATLGQQLGNWQSHEVAYALARSEGLDPGGLPASLATAAGGTDNYPIWLWPDSSYTTQEINPALASVTTPTPSSNCDGYTGLLTMQVDVKSLLTALPAGAPAGKTWTFTSPLGSEYPVECWSAGTELDPNAMTDATVTFTVTLRYAPPEPPPVFAPCDVSGVDPVSFNERLPSTTNLWAPMDGPWVWTGVSGQQVTASIWPLAGSNDYSVSVSDTGATTIDGCVPNPYAASAGAVPEVFDSIPTFTEVDPLCYRILPTPFASRESGRSQRIVVNPIEIRPPILPQPILGNPALRFTAQGYTVDLQLFQQSCSNGVTGGYEVLYTRRNSSGAVIVEELMTPRTLLE